ncbi:hypothetical protein OG618_37600 (plasmid) [Kitasatospora sp. NBC_01246]|uniref:hypothetical protein n=1 Tax=Kitasatospora sp. NBC_01246 TaxID=2903570 RepID=UPI002E345A0F|nr:hypothetical protein [Kitasatospora sp. NBC_01246]
MQNTTSRAARFAAAYALLRAAADVADHWVQSDYCAQAKGATDDAPVTYADEKTAQTTTVGTEGGVRACVWHCFTYTATQGVVLVGGARVLGIRLHPAAVAGALALSGLTHYAADRRVPDGLLQRLAKATGKSRFYKLADFGMNGSYCLDQAFHHGAETVAAAIASR